MCNRNKSIYKVIIKCKGLALKREVLTERVVSHDRDMWDLSGSVKDGKLSQNIAQTAYIKTREWYPKRTLCEKAGEISIAYSNGGLIRQRTPSVA